MLESIGKKFIHCFVIASIVFGCSVQAATPSFQEDLDDFEEITQLVTTPPAVQFDPNSISWHNKELTQLLASSFGVADDLEQLSIHTVHIPYVSPSKESFHTFNLEVFHSYLIRSHLPRAPPLASINL